MIQELENMCSSMDFDAARANDLLKTVDVNEEFRDSEYGYPCTLLSLATENSNIAFVKILLENGADPNHLYDNETESAFWNLQYGDEKGEESAVRLQIAELFLQHGADPHLNVEGEDLFFWAIQGQIDSGGDLFNHRERFISLLEKYGA